MRAIYAYSGERAGGSHSLGNKCLDGKEKQMKKFKLIWGLGIEYHKRCKDHDHCTCARVACR